MNTSLFKKRYTVGTLEYSFWQMMNIFFWMLWGSIALTSLGQTFGASTKFLYRANGLSDTFLAVVTGTIFGMINVVMNPVLSTMSDRHRGRLGRRVPYILYTALPTAFFLAAMPFYPYLIRLLPETILGFSTVSLVFGAGSILYWFFYLYVAILYFYLIPDVIPAELMGRFYGLFRVSGVIFGTAFSWWVYKYVQDFPQYIYPACAVFYLLTIGGMCYFVREGDYPPPENSGSKLPWYKKLVATVKQYISDCYGHKYYLVFYITGVAYGVHGCINMFMDFFYLEGCGLTMAELGKLGAILGVVGMISCFCAGFVTDKLGAFATSIISLLLLALSYFSCGIFIHGYTSALILRIPQSVFGCIYAVAAGRILVEVYPRSKFGMMASGSNLLTSLVAALINIPFGLFSDFMRNSTPETTLMLGKYDLMPLLKGYRFTNYYAGFCILVSMLLLTYFYFHYQRKRVGNAFDE